MKKILLITLATLFSTFLFANAVEWVSYSQAQKLSASSHKPIYLYLYSSSCFYCHKMEQDTFQNPKVISQLNANFIPTKINISTTPSAISEFNVQGTPFNVFISGQKTVGQLSGYLPPDNFLKLLTYIKTQKIS